tara:strand:+ start:2159 stop:2590 length:432 start_codon:yes stop_codon:yes gene_type:complete
MAKANDSNNTKYVEHIKLSTTLLKELEKYNEVIAKIDELGKLALADEGCIIDIQLFIKVTPSQTEDEDSDKKENLLDAIKNSDSPEAFLKHLDAANSKKDAEPKYHELQIDELNNSTFLAMLDKILGNYKSLSNQLLTKIKTL